MKDIPQLDSNVFIFYSAATGLYRNEIEAGYAPGHIRNTCTVRTLTPMKVTGSGFSKKDISIKPVFNTAKTVLSFDIKLFECNFSEVGSFSLTIETAGNGDLGIEGTRHTVKFRVMCYGLDRAYLRGNYAEYNKFDDTYYTEQLGLASCNGVIDTHLSRDNMAGSGFTVKRNNKQKLVYEGSPSEPGLYGVSVNGVTFFGGDNVSPRPPNGFPAGGGADCRIVSVYDGYFKKKDTCPAIPGRFGLLPEGRIEMFPVFALYLDKMGANGGVFTPVVSGNQLLYFERLVINRIAVNSTETHEYRICCGGTPDKPSGKLSDKWVLYYRYYLDQNKAAWQRIASVPVLSVDVPCLDDGTERHFTGVATVPPFSGWGKMYATGDAAYWMKGKGFFHTALLISNDKEFEPFTVYVGTNGEILTTKVVQTYQEKDETKTRILFQEAESWIIAGNGEKASPQNVDCTVLPYAPPKEGDGALNIAVKGEVRGKEQEFNVPQALNLDNPDLALSVSGVAGGIWKRYPLQRLIAEDWSDSVTAVVSGKMSDKFQNQTVSAESHNTTGNRQTDFPSVYSQSWTTYDHYDYTKERDNTNMGDGASFSADIPMDGYIKDKNGLYSICGMTTQDGLKFKIYGSQYEYERKSTTNDERTEIREWVSVPDRYITVVRNDEEYQVLSVLNKHTYAITTPLPDDESSVTETIKSRVTEPESGTGEEAVVDCFLHIGQCDKADSRKITQAASYFVDVRGDVKTHTTVIEETRVDGELQPGAINKTTEGTQSVSMRGWGAEAYARTANPNGGVGSKQEPEEENAPSYKIVFTLSKSEGYTCEKTTNEYEERELGKGETVLSWQDDDGDTHEETFEHKCFGLEGQLSKREKTYAHTISASATYTYDAATDTASLTMSAPGEMTLDYDYSAQYTDTYEANGTDKRFPFAQKRDSSIRRVVSQTVAEGSEVTYRYKAERGAYERTEKITYGAKYRATYDGKGGVVIDPNSGWGEVEGETNVTEVHYDPRRLRTIFDDFVSQFSNVTENFEPPEGDWDYIDEYAGYTDAPLVANSHACSYHRSVITDEVTPLELSVSFKS